MIKILYVHGYNGKPNGGSFQKLAKYAEVADFDCGKIFPAELVRNFAYEFEDNPNTAICPYCMIDSVLADADWKDLSPAFLEKMYKRFFENHIDLND